MKSIPLTRNIAALFAAAALASSAVFAGGPLLIFDPATKTPYAWPNSYAPVYTDLGGLGQLTSDQARNMVSFSVDRWNVIPTSSFRGEVVGDFASIGLPDIDASNLGLVMGAWNNGGVHIIYDADGSIFTALFGWPYGIYGVTIVEWVGDASPAILEVTMILNGVAVPGDWESPEQAAAEYAGVVTHEFGHAINLAHTQTNGQLYSYYDAWSGPSGCATPYEGWPGASDLETMYPFTSIGEASANQATLHILDDIAALSDIYPAAGWPNAYPSIDGAIKVPLTDKPHARTQEVTSVNVIARNVANPWQDAISAISGAFSQGQAGPDGTYHFHGLTPGASYAVYVDGILAGAFPTPFLSVLPGPEEYWNGANESGDGVTDDRCAWQTIAPAAGSPFTANVIFNRVKGAPEFFPIDMPNSGIAELSGDGQVAAGYSDWGLFRWTPAETQMLGGDIMSPSMGISHDGRTIVASALDANGIEQAAIWQGGQNWMLLGNVPGGASCDYYESSAWGVSNNQTVVGLAWLGCRNTTGFQWQSDTGMTALGYLGGDSGGSRADKISADGSTIVGWDRMDWGFWRGAMWRDGQESIIHQTPALCCDGDGCIMDAVGEANNVNPDGSIIIGSNYNIPRVYVDPWSGEEFHYCDSAPWRWTPSSGLAEPLDAYQPESGAVTNPFDLSDDGSVMVGRADNWWWGILIPLLWTSPTGWLDFQQFLAAQGTFATDWTLSPVTVSGDGKVVGGWASTPAGRQGFIVTMPKVVVCHAPKGSPSNKKTITVDFPGSLGDHLAHGDVIGVCGDGQ